MKTFRCKFVAWMFSAVSGLLVVLIFSSASNASDSRKLWQSRDQFVALERQDSPGGANSHPVVISPERLSAILASIELQSPDSKKPEQLITSQSLEVLVPEMVEGFKKAAPGEDVTFAVIGLHKSLFGLAKSPRVTTGRAFYKDGRLNVIFGFAQKEFNEREDRRLSPFTPGSRLKAAEDDWALLPQSGQKGFELLRKDWVTFSDAWQAAVVQAPVPEKIAPPPQTPPVAERNVPPPAPAPVQPARQQSETRKPAERLTTLNELKDKGLISEEEYRAKRAEILNGL